MPSLRSMYYFEAVARHGSFTEASRELRISQAAVSHQIKLLEHELGTAMLSRSTRRVVLTRSGEALFNAVTQALNILSDATTRIRSSVDAMSSQLSLNVTPFFSGYWLLPRLPRFSDRFPKTQLNLHHSQRQPSLQLLNENNGSHVFVMYGDGVWEGFHTDYLFSADLVPMCSPALLRGRTTLSKPEDILSFPLVHEFNYEWWGRWFELSGIRRAAVNFGPVVDDPNVMISAALSLQGMVLAPPLFFRQHIKAGLLMMPVGDEVRIPIDYHLIIPLEAMVNLDMRNLREWLLSEAESYRSEEPQSLPIRRQ